MSKAGFVALVGTPNAGKSTLFNRLVGERLAAITPKPQTTRFRIPGILTKGEVQYIFVDTPGWIGAPKNVWHHSLNHQSLTTAKEADVVVWVIPGHKPLEAFPEAIQTFLEGCATLIGALTHLDLLPPTERSTRIALWRSDLSPFPLKALIDVSTDQPLEPLLEAIAQLLPKSPFLYPPEELTTLPTRFFVAEILREKLYQHLHEELPYGTEVEITTYRESPEKDYIAATIYVEKESHKPMIIGTKGQMIKKIGMEARKEIEQFLGKSVFLELYVKVAPAWRHSQRRLHSLGYQLP
ncbi:MAG: GTPase Era [Bacteroidia bacterium]|nr:MAG: GTPase Era [Bacteroidia bacterium]